jgi:splicing factor 3B subunit 2
VNVEYVSERLDVPDAALEAFSDVFARFQLPPESSNVRPLVLVRLIGSIN